MACNCSVEWARTNLDSDPVPDRDRHPRREALFRNFLRWRQPAVRFRLRRRVCRQTGAAGIRRAAGWEWTPLARRLAFAGMGSGRDVNAPPSSGMSAVVPVQPSARRSRQNALIQPAEMTRKQNPYTDIPSLYDMYLQAVPRPATPKRFGSEVFENGTRDPQLIPMDLPVGPDYVVGPGDGLSIDLVGRSVDAIFPHGGSGRADQSPRSRACAGQRQKSRRRATRLATDTAN